MMGFRVHECLLVAAACVGLAGCFDGGTATGSQASTQDPPSAQTPATTQPSDPSNTNSTGSAQNSTSELQFMYSPGTSVAVGTRYGYGAVVKGGNGKTLTWNIANKPAWAFFDTTTGELIGIPETKHIGAWNNIVITVTDGTRSKSLESFSITVSQVAIDGSASLSWVPPVENEDGSALTNLAGYRIYSGSSPSSMSLIRTISNPGITTAVIDGLGAGQVYFAISSYTTSGQESDRVPMGNKTIS